MAISKDNIQVTVIISRELDARLAAYARRHRWSKSAAGAALIEDGLDQDTQDQETGTGAGNRS